MNIRSSLPKFTHELTLTLEALTPGAPPRQIAEWKLDIGRYFSVVSVPTREYAELTESRCQPLLNNMIPQKGEFMEGNLVADVTARLREPAAAAALTRSDKKA